MTTGLKTAGGGYRPRVSTDPAGSPLLILASIYVSDSHHHARDVDFSRDFHQAVSPMSLAWWWIPITTKKNYQNDTPVMKYSITFAVSSVAHIEPILVVPVTAYRPSMDV
ncbi:hypothetical protein DIRU0_D04874 [Diutina rugosa]